MEETKRYVYYDTLDRAIQAIDLATQRGAFHGSEIFQIGMVREKLSASLQNVPDGEEVIDTQVAMATVEANGGVVNDSEMQDMFANAAVTTGEIRVDKKGKVSKKKTH